MLKSKQRGKVIEPIRGKDKTTHIAGKIKF